MSDLLDERGQPCQHKIIEEAKRRFNELGPAAGVSAGAGDTGDRLDTVMRGSLVRRVYREAQIQSRDRADRLASIAHRELRHRLSSLRSVMLSQYKLAVNSEPLALDDHMLYDLGNQFEFYIHLCEQYHVDHADITKGWHWLMKQLSDYWQYGKPPSLPS